MSGKQNNFVFGIIATILFAISAIMIAAQAISILALPTSSPFLPRFIVDQANSLQWLGMILATVGLVAGTHYMNANNNIISRIAVAVVGVVEILIGLTTAMATGFSQPSLIVVVLTVVLGITFITYGIKMKNPLMKGMEMV